MKQDALNVFAQDQVAAADKLYDAGFADGVASVPASPGGFSQADMDAAVAAGKAELQLQVENLMLQLSLDEAKIAQVKALLG